MGKILFVLLGRQAPDKAGVQVNVLFKVKVRKLQLYQILQWLIKMFLAQPQQLMIKTQHKQKDNFKNKKLH